MQPKTKCSKGSEKSASSGTAPALSDSEMVLQSVQVCREARQQGVHEDDVLDMLVGLTDEVRAQVKTILNDEEISETQ